METKNKVITWKVSECSESSYFSNQIASTLSRKSSNQSSKDWNKEKMMGDEFVDFGHVSPHDKFQPSTIKNRNKLVTKVTKLMKSKGVKSSRDASNDQSTVDQRVGGAK